MNHKDRQKPYYIPANFLVPTKSGWCDTRNHNEVIIAYPHLDTLVAQDLANSGNSGSTGSSGSSENSGST